MVTFSFELFPPRTAAASLALSSALDHLVAAGPEFVSVTYGANGSSRESSLAVLGDLLARGVNPMAHLTCVGSSIIDEKRIIREFLEVGITSFLALRGDPPEGHPAEKSFLGELRSASELVQLIHHVQGEKEQYRLVDVPGTPSAKRLRSPEKVTIAVAAFPNGHPRSRSSSQDVDTLLAKQAAGANLAITQLFFHPDDYLGFVDNARAAGVTLRIVPGIMPITGVRQLHRIVELTGEPMPTGILKALQASDSVEAQLDLGITRATALAAEVLDGGADGLHLYTFNRHEAVLGVLAGVGLIDLSRTISPGSRGSRTKENV